MIARAPLSEQSARRLAALRLRAQSLVDPAPDAAAAVERMLAVQGQDYPGALWSIGIRTAHPDRAAVERELDGGDLVRTWPMRGTLHVLRAEDAGWLTALTRERGLAAAAGRHRQLGLDDAQFARAAAIADAELDHRRLDRAALLDAFVEGGVPIDGQRGAHLLVRLAQEGRVVLCSGRTFARAADRIPSPRRLERPAALAELAERYIAGHGPATDRDLAWWAGITLTDARAGLAAIRERVDAVDLDGATYFLRPGLEPAAGVWALAGFDEFLLGYTDRRAALLESPLERVVPGSNGMFLATIVVDGEVVGTWRRGRRTRAGLELEVDRWRPLPRRHEAAARRALERWAEFVGEPLVAPVIEPLGEPLVEPPSGG